MNAPELDPELQAVLPLLPPRPILEAASFVQVVRSGRVTMYSEMPDVPGVSYRDTAFEADGRSIGLRIVTPAGARPDRPAMLWIHGGGYFLGGAFEPDPRLLHWASQLDCVIVSVDYRLAPETPYPGALEDCYAALQWTIGNAAELGIDLGRLAIGGISAGGGLCAALALLCRERGESTPCFQLLIYPMIDDRGESASSQYEDAPIWYRRINELAWEAYLGPDHLSRELPVHAAPARAAATDLVGLPPAFINVGTVDIFVDENIAYAQRLLAARVPCELHVYPGAFHGFDSLMPHTRIAQAANLDIVEALRRALIPVS